MFLLNKVAFMQQLFGECDIEMNSKEGAA